MGPNNQKGKSAKLEKDESRLHKIDCNQKQHNPRVRVSANKLVQLWSLFLWKGRVMSCPIIIASFDFSCICVLRKGCNSGCFSPTSYQHKYRSINAASFCTFFFPYTFKMELLKFSSMAGRLTSHGSGKQARMCVLRFTSIPVGIFIQLRQQLGIYFLEYAGRQIGWEKQPLSSGRGLGGGGPNQEPPSLSASQLVGKAFVTHVARGLLTVLEVEQKGTQPSR